MTGREGPGRLGGEPGGWRGLPGDPPGAVGSRLCPVLPRVPVPVPVLRVEAPPLPPSLRLRSRGGAGPGLPPPAGKRRRGRKAEGTG